MDSMRSLNKSLPSSSSSSRPAPPEQLLQAFRTAALSVTNLYKSAVSDQNASKQAGYQEALEDLLGFLDRENLGLQDGEGWRVREWATERYDGSAHQQGTESDDEKSELDQRPRSISPVRQPPAEHTRINSEPPKLEVTVQPNNTPAPLHREATPAPPAFQFTGQPSSDNMQTDEAPAPAEESQSSSATTTVAPVRLEVHNNRGSRTPYRSGNQRSNTRLKAGEFTFTAGTKRKIQFPDFFDISNIGPRDGSGGNKRGRMS